MMSLVLLAFKKSRKTLVIVNHTCKYWICANYLNNFEDKKFYNFDINQRIFQYYNEEFEEILLKIILIILSDICCEGGCIRLLEFFWCFWKLFDFLKGSFKIRKNFKYFCKKFL